MKWFAECKHHRARQHSMLELQSSDVQQGVGSSGLVIRLALVTVCIDFAVAYVLSVSNSLRAIQSSHSSCTLNCKSRCAVFPARSTRLCWRFDAMSVARTSLLEFIAPSNSTRGATHDMRGATHVMRAALAACAVYPSALFMLCHCR